MSVFRIGAAAMACLALSATASAAPLSEAAQSMSKGEWRELATTGLTKELLETQSTAIDSIMQWGAKAAWEPQSQMFLFAGAPHGGARKMIRYKAVEDKWELGPIAPGQGAHSYYYSATQTEGGRWYRYLSEYDGGSAGVIGVYDPQSSSWSVLPGKVSRGGVGPKFGGFAYFPERNGFLMVAGWRGGYWYDKASSTWTSIDYQNDDIHDFALYNPVHKVVMFGGGGTGDNFNMNFWIMEADGSIKGPYTSPQLIRTSKGHITVDPVTGKYLVIFDGRQMFEYDVPTNSWARIPDPPSEFAQSHDANGRWVAAPINTHGVVMYLMYRPRPTVFLYRHGEGIGTIDTVPPDTPGNLTSD